MLAQAIYFGFRIGEVSCPTKYFEDASSINFRRSVKYGLGVLGTSILFRLNRWGLAKSRIFARDGRRLDDASVPADYYREELHEAPPVATVASEESARGG